VFVGLNLYLGNYIGEFLGEVCLASFFFLTGLSYVKESRFPNWLGWCGVVFAALFAIGAFRNVSSAVQPIADINNGLLPLWMVVLGVSLVWCSRESTFQGDANPSVQADACRHHSTPTSRTSGFACINASSGPSTTSLIAVGYVRVFDETSVHPGVGASYPLGIQPHTR
jgi:hypothetical protein